jgi:hypothetical protein
MGQFDNWGMGQFDNGEIGKLENGTIREFGNNLSLMLGVKLEKVSEILNSQK